MAGEAKNSKAAKEKFFKRIGRFFREIRSELKKVVWPNRKQLLNSTISVLMICLLIGAVIWITDQLLYQIVTKAITGQ